MMGVILAGGTGSRLYPLTKVTNKHLLPVYDEPMIYKVIKTLKNSGIKEIVIVLGGESVGDFIRLLENGEEFGVNIYYVYQKGAGGIAEALYLTKKIVEGNSIAVLLGDNIFEDSFSEEVKNFEKDQENGCYLFLKEVLDPNRFGVAYLNQEKKIVKIIEKPKNPESNYAVTGLYFYKPDIFNKIQEVIDSIGYSSRGELEITDVNNLYVRENRAKAIFIQGFWSDAGKFDTLLRSANFIKELKNKQQKNRALNYK
ncbi:MAG: sugar phosphate nucleotidyltransferase [Promethearchaeota archaeon]